MAATAGFLAVGPTSTMSEADEPAGAVVFIGTGGITWSDVDEETTPNLWAMLKDGSSAALSVRSVNSNTCPIDGWLGLSAGGRAGGPRTGPAANPARRPCPGPPTVTDGSVVEWPTYVEAASDEKFDSTLGLLADVAQEGGLCVRTVQPYAAVGGALPDGEVERYSPWSSDTLLEDLNGCPVTLVDVGSLRDPDDVALGEATTGTREEQLTEIDTRIGQVLEAGPGGADFIVGSISDAGETERLRLVVARGPHYGPGVLESGSTRQKGLAQSSDLTATILASVGLPVPDSVGGAPLTSVPAPDNSEKRAADRLQTLVDYDEASHDVHDLVEPFFTVFAYGQLVIYLVVLLVYKGRIGSEASRVKVLSRVRVLAVAAASVPVSTFLANLIPWWRFPSEMLAVLASVGLFVTIISLVALRGPWSRWAMGPLAVVSATTMTVLAVDIISGSRLQLSSLMGLQPVVAGRFYGMGNPTFALFATAAILLATAVSSALVSAGRRRDAALAVALIGGFAVLVDGAPFWGADGGGPPALVPGFVYLVMAVLGIRLTWKTGAADPRQRGRPVLPHRRPGLAPGPLRPQPPRPLHPVDHRRERDGHRRAQGRAEHLHPARQRATHPPGPGRPALRHLRAGPADVVGVAGDAAVLRPGPHPQGRALRPAGDPDHRLPHQRLRRGDPGRRRHPGGPAHRVGDGVLSPGRGPRRRLHTVRAPAPMTTSQSSTTTQGAIPRRRPSVRSSTSADIPSTRPGT